MAKKKKSKYAGSPDKDPALKPLYDKLRKEFTAVDLQRYTVEEERVPLSHVIAQMEKMHNDWMKRKQRKAKK